MSERDHPRGHPSASDFDAVKDAGLYVPPAPYARDWPKGHPAAVESGNCGTAWRMGEDPHRPGVVPFKGLPAGAEDYTLAAKDPLRPGETAPPAPTAPPVLVPEPPAPPADPPPADPPADPPATPPADPAPPADPGTI